MTPSERSTLLSTAVGEGCSVSETFVQGLDRERKAYWNVRCRNGKTYAIALSQDGSSRVLECGTLKAVAGVECFKKF
jgi:hypothetical protein